MEPLTRRQTSEQPGIEDWRVIGHSLRTSFTTGSMAVGADLVGRIVAAADAADHHPLLTVRYGSVDVLLTTHEAGGLSDRDVSLAQVISAIARALDVTADPGAVGMVEIAVDVLDRGAVRPFWAAVYGLAGDLDPTGDDVVDPAGRLPSLWFQQMDEPRPQRNRIHLDLLVPHDVARHRIAAALGAGGRLVSDAAAPQFWILADAEGNEVCVCTWEGRD
jgi:4a-hydroxytetrahydrobiopterin dehydratase